MTFTHQAGATDNTNGTSYAKTIPALAGGGVLWVTVLSKNFATGSPPAPTVTMTGATFTQVHTQVMPVDWRLTVFYSQDYDPGSSVAVTFGFGAATMNGMIWSVDEDDDGLISGSASTQANSTVATTTNPLATSLSAGTGKTFVAFAIDAAVTVGANPTSTGTELASLDMASGPAGGLLIYWHTATQTAPSVTVGGGSNRMIIALEAALGTPPSTPQAEVAWAQVEIPLIPSPALVAPATVQSQLETPELVVAVPGQVTPEPVIVVDEVGMPSPTGYVLVPITARGVYMFYRQVNTTELALVPLGNSQPIGFKRSETWQRVSSRFVANTGTADYVMGLMTAVWPAMAEAPQDELTAAINHVLYANGYMAPGRKSLV